MARQSSSVDHVYELLRTVHDPEIPVLSIMDMGVVRKVEVKNNHVAIEITPTYSGCPAMDVIEEDITALLESKGFKVSVELVLSPAWSTDWINASGRKALEDYGIAAPLDEATDKRALLGGKRLVKCTRCGSDDTEVLNEFGSTACKALFRCKTCLEPFDYFKCLT